MHLPTYLQTLGFRGVMPFEDFYLTLLRGRKDNKALLLAYFNMHAINTGSVINQLNTDYSDCTKYGIRGEVAHCLDGKAIEITERYDSFYVLYREESYQPASENLDEVLEITVVPEVTKAGQSFLKDVVSITKISEASNNLDKVQNIVDKAFKTANNEASHLLIEARGYLADILEDSQEQQSNDNRIIDHLESMAALHACIQNIMGENSTLLELGDKIVELRSKVVKADLDFAIGQKMVEQADEILPVHKPQPDDITKFQDKWNDVIMYKGYVHNPIEPDAIRKIHACQEDYGLIAVFTSEYPHFPYLYHIDDIHKIDGVSIEYYFIMHKDFEKMRGTDDFPADSAVRKHKEVTIINPDRENSVLITLAGDTDVWLLDLFNFQVSDTLYLEKELSSGRHVKFSWHMGNIVVSADGHMSYSTQIQALKDLMGTEIVLASTDIDRPEMDNAKLSSIYDLPLHESMKIRSDFHVTRIPGGWIYETHDSDLNQISTVFVPFSREFFDNSSGCALCGK